MTKTPILLALAAAIAATAIPAIAQPGWRPGDPWNRSAFWNGAPAGIRERIDWLQERINRGVRDGSRSRDDVSHSAA